VFGAVNVVEAFDEDFDAGEPLLGAVVEEVGFEPVAGGVVIDGFEELAEAIGAWVAVFDDGADGHAWEAGAVFELAGVDGGVFEVLGDFDGEVTHGGGGIRLILLECNLFLKWGFLVVGCGH
jgi:hypothetical protein